MLLTDGKQALVYRHPARRYYKTWRGDLISLRTYLVTPSGRILNWNTYPTAPVEVYDSDIFHNVESLLQAGYQPEAVSAEADLGCLRHYVQERADVGR